MKKSLFLSALILMGCQSANNTLDEIAGVVGKGDGKGGGAYVSGAVEYVGPPDRWAGPESFILQVDTRLGSEVHVSVSPRLKNGYQKFYSRKLASVKGMSVDQARGFLSRIGDKIGAAENRSYRGCLSPIRVRLVKSDGTVVSGEGCRGTQGWARNVSQAVADFLEVAKR